MSPQKEAAAAAAHADTQELGLLESAIAATKQTERDKAKDLIETLTKAALDGTVTWHKNVSATIKAGVAALDAVISKQLAAVMHAPEFQKLEGSWRGLNYLVYNSETNDQLKIKVFNCTKRELFKDLTDASEFDQSHMFKNMYEAEFGMAGGQPYGALIGDYEFSNHPDDVTLISKISNVAASGFCPFISAAAPGLCGLESWTKLGDLRDLKTTFDSVAYTQWKSFRDSEDSRFVVLTMPRSLARLPYGSNTKPIDEFGYEEVELDKKGKPKSVPHDQYCWMNSAYVMGTKLTDAFSKTGWCTAIRGAENGGKVEGLPAHVFKAEDGDLDLKCPTEIPLTDRREKELSDIGFLPLVHYKNTDYAVFFGAQTTQKPKKYDKASATANAAISARLPYIMATGRIAHYLKVIARDKIGSFMERENCEQWLNNWIANYVATAKNPSPEEKARYPLAEAKIEVKEIPGSPGAYNAVAWLRPWLQLEELNASLRMVASIPKLQS